MSGRGVTAPAFATRPGDPEAWVRTETTASTASLATEIYSARLTVDVTPVLRGRIKVAAFRRGVTVAVMLRGLLDEAFPEAAGNDQ